LSIAEKTVDVGQQHMYDTRYLSIHALLLIALTTALGACTLLPAGQKSPLNTYLLSLDAAPDSALPSCEAGSATLLVNVPRAQSGFDTSRMAYLRQPHEVQYYAYHQWADTPARMLAPLLVQGLDEMGCWHTVVQMPVVVQGNYRLDTNILHWQQEFFTEPSRVRLTVRAYLVDLRAQNIIAAQRFEILANAPSEDAPGGVAAAHEALAILLRRIAEWIAPEMNRNNVLPSY
jgi:cholesterol transport system auxiliary component